jgi:hypothetical protein
MKAMMTLTLLLSMSSQLWAGVKEQFLARAQAMTPQEIWQILTSVGPSGQTFFGSCRLKIEDTGYCKAYFKGAILNKKDTGFPLNPLSGDGTGCVFASNEKIPYCPAGHDPSTMCTSNPEVNAKAMLIAALQEDQDRCGLGMMDIIEPPHKTIGISDTAKLLFVEPNEVCANGRIYCGTTRISDRVGKYKIFTELPKKFCTPAYALHLKKKARLKAQGFKVDKDDRIISCQSFVSKKSSSAKLQAAIGLMLERNDPLPKVSYFPFLDMKESDLKELSDEQLLIYYVVFDKNPGLILSSLRPRLENVLKNSPKKLSLAEREVAKRLRAADQAESSKSLTLEEALAVLPSHNN